MRLAVGFVLAVLAVAASAGISFGRDSAPRITGIIPVAEIERSSTTNGDRSGTTSTIVIRKTGKRLGISRVGCERFASEINLCSGTYQFPLGRIMVAGSRRSSSYFVFAVIGGTGIYAGAGGTLVATASAPGRRRLFFSLVS